MKNSLKKLTFLALAGTVAFASCEKTKVNDPIQGSDPETITTVKFTFAEANNPNAVVRATYRDADGPGGNAPGRFDSIVLKPNLTYNVAVELLNESVTPTDTITNEIIDEANDHQFFYNPQGVNVTVAYNDQDGNTPPLPVGLKTIWTTGATSNGNVLVRLKHQPGIKDGNVTTGETDIELNFNTRIR